MPLLDHFHPPVSERRRWEGFHGLWAATLVEKLNCDVLADEYFADMQVHIGSQVEVDIATLEEPRGSSGTHGATATVTAAASVWAPPAATLVVPPGAVGVWQAAPEGPGGAFQALGVRAIDGRAIAIYDPPERRRWLR